jgi:hypothetical protein
MSTAPHWRDEADKHDMRIHRAKQLARPVLHAGTKKHIAGFCHHDGDEEMVVYLKGSAAPVRPCEITILEQHHE